MSSYLARLLKAQTASKRLVSQLVQRKGKLSSLLQRVGLKKWTDTAAARAISTTPVLKAEMADDMELATGIAKREMQLKEQGCGDPWGLGKILKRGSGRLNDPTEIPSAFDGRLVGCLCLDDRFAKWMWLEEGPPKRCECGHYFVLKKVPPV
ncbi:GL25677 [Drosophila persimilis]|uniref:Cytochrome c oxidase subunit 5B, mitochondrial n=2 Tax=pseudoobscura subgroup TaxID=32358 RepID=Q29PC9_DROPS|nr:cytochrome c oxidase subunit 5B, mitochondrial [Drosophila pseudoobscura]XP_002018958.1 cytochrome c oxidase subunit 5B, mitochondrial [Drosophila persimilis]EDW37154.1 GL25677 [Drosophila persimilis]